MAGYRWDNPFLTGTGGEFYDPGTMRALILRSQRGDNAAREHLRRAGYYGDFGQEIWGNPTDSQQGFFDNSLNAWAQNKNLKPYTGPEVFRWQPAYDADPNAFNRAFETWFGGQLSQPQAAAQQGAQAAANTIAGAANEASTGVATAAATSGNSRGQHAGWMVGKPVLTRQTLRPGQTSLDFGDSGIPDWSYEDGQIMHRLGNTAAVMTDEDWVQKMMRDSNWDRGRAVEQVAGWYDYNHLDRSLSSIAEIARSAPRTSVYTGKPGQPGGDVPYVPVTPSTAGTGGGSTGGTGGGTRAGSTGGSTGGGTGGGTTGTTGTAGTGETSMDTENTLLNTDPNYALEYVMQRLGIDPFREGVHTGTIRQILENIVPAWQQLRMADLPAGEAGSYADTGRQGMAQLVDMLRSGTGFGQLSQFGQRLGADTDWLSSLEPLGDVEQANREQLRLALSLAGVSPLRQQALMAAWAQEFGPRGAANQGGRYGQYSATHMGEGRLTPRQWLQQSRWAGLFQGL